MHPRHISPARSRVGRNRISWLLKHVLLATIFGAACVAPGVAQKQVLPPLFEPASVEHLSGKVIFVELVTPDIAAAKQFYAGMLAGPIATFSWTASGSRRRR